MTYEYKNERGDELYIDGLDKDNDFEIEICNRYDEKITIYIPKEVAMEIVKIILKEVKS